MSDNDFIRRGDARQAVIASTGAMDAVSNINALPAAPTFTAADLEAAFRIGLAMAADENDCGGCASYGGNCVDPTNCWHEAANEVRALSPPADLAKLVKGGEG